MVVFRAYGTTIGLTIVGTVLGLLLQTMTAYVLSRKEFEWRNQFSFFFTCLSDCLRNLVAHHHIEI